MLVLRVELLQLCVLVFCVLCFGVLCFVLLCSGCVLSYEDQVAVSTLAIEYQWCAISTGDGSVVQVVRVASSRWPTRCCSLHATLWDLMVEVVLVVSLLVRQQCKQSQAGQHVESWCAHAKPSRWIYSLKSSQWLIVTCRLHAMVTEAAGLDR